MAESDNISSLARLEPEEMSKPVKPSKGLRPAPEVLPEKLPSIAETLKLYNAEETLAEVELKSSNDFEYVRLDGYAINSAGEIFKTDYLAVLNLPNDEYSNIIMTKKKATTLLKKLKHTKTGLTAVVPLICAGSLCPFANECPYQALEIAPIGAHCAIEVDLVESLTTDFIQEYAVDVNNLTEIALIREIAESYVYERRATIILNKENDGTLSQDEVVGFDAATNTPISRKTLHWAWTLKERCKNRRMRNFEALLGTRKEKLRERAILGDKSGDLASTHAELRRKLEDARRATARFEEVEVLDDKNAKSK